MLSKFRRKIREEELTPAGSVARLGFASYRPVQLTLSESRS
ncbi:MAG TPA: hypothetical protein VGF41_04605 [Myxococcaceae bacterium]